MFQPPEEDGQQTEERKSRVAQFRFVVFACDQDDNNHDHISDTYPVGLERLYDIALVHDMGTYREQYSQYCPLFP